MAEKQSVLIVDDQPRNLFALEKVLAELDITLVKAQSGNEALAATLNHQFALGILDVRMPGMDGCELADLLRADERTKRLPLIFLTASDGAEEKVFRGYAAGAVDYIVKPYSPEVLLAKVNIFLALDRQQVELQSYRLHLEDLIQARTRDLQDATDALQIKRDAAVARAQELVITLETLKQTQAQLAQSQKMEAIGRLAGGVAHDFNNILVVILGYAGFVLETVKDDEKAVQDCEQILKAGHRAATLTRQLLAFSRKQALEPRVLELNEIVRDLRKMLDRLIGEDVSILLELEPALDRVLADPGQLEQVIVNLVVNARDAMPNGGKLIIETANVVLDEAYVLKHFAGKAGAYVLLTVSDTGSGMDAATQAKIFEPFFTTKEAGKGTGLGLATVYGIVAQSGGFIWVYSELGIGTSFKIYLPRSDEMPRARAVTTAASPAMKGKETILVVEDDHEVRGLAVRILKSLGYNVLHADGLHRTREIARAENDIHLLVTDVVMAGGGGREVSEAVHERHPAAKVLFMSGHTGDTVLHHGVIDPGVAFLNKPFTRESLGKQVRDVLDAVT